jgi:hypothetical protein
MALKANPWMIDSNDDDHDFKCFAVQSKDDLGIMPSAVDSECDGHELRVSLADSKYDAQEPISFVDSKHDL